MSIIHIPFYPSDWLAGTLGLSDAEKGVYITLIARMYEMAGPIERDDDRLYRVCGSKSKASFVKSLNYLISEGKVTITEDGLFNEKVAKVIEQTIEKSSKARDAAQSRWSRKSNKNNDRGNANASAKHMPEQCQLEPELELKKEETNVSCESAAQAIDEIAEAVSHFNAIAMNVKWPQVQKVSPQRRSALKARIKDVGGLDAWCEAITRAGKSPHLTGNNNRGWTATFDWLVNPTNFTKLMEGNYDERSNAGNQQQSNSNARSGAHHSLMAGFADAANS